MIEEIVVVCTGRARGSQHLCRFVPGLGAALRLHRPSSALCVRDARETDGLLETLVFVVVLVLVFKGVMTV